MRSDRKEVHDVLLDALITCFGGGTKFGRLDTCFLRLTQSTRQTQGGLAERGDLRGRRQEIAIAFAVVSPDVTLVRVEDLPTYPTIDRSSDCLFNASARIFASTRFTSPTGNLRNTSSGSTALQSVSPLSVCCGRLRRETGVIVPGVDAAPRLTCDGRRKRSTEERREKDESRRSSSGNGAKDVLDCRVLCIGDKGDVGDIIR